MRYWDCESGTVVSTLWGSAAAIFAMRIAPDGRTVVTAGGESSCRVWDLRTASCVRTFGQYNSQVRGGVGVFLMGKKLVCNQDHVLVSRLRNHVLKILGGYCALVFC